MPIIRIINPNNHCPEFLLTMFILIIPLLQW